LFLFFILDRNFSGIRNRHAKPKWSKPPIPSGHASDQHKKEGRRYVIRLRLIPTDKAGKKLSFQSRKSSRT
jgi:hypothetical protein